MTKQHNKITVKFPGEKEHQYFMMALDVINHYVRKPKGHEPLTEKQFAANCCMHYAAQILNDFKKAQEEERERQAKREATAAAAEEAGAHTADEPEAGASEAQSESAKADARSEDSDSGKSQEPASDVGVHGQAKQDV